MKIEGQSAGSEKLTVLAAAAVNVVNAEELDAALPAATTRAAVSVQNSQFQLADVSPIPSRLSFGAGQVIELLDPLAGLDVWAIAELPERMVAVMAKKSELGGETSIQNPSVEGF